MKEECCRRLEGKEGRLCINRTNTAVRYVLASLCRYFYAHKSKLARKRANTNMLYQVRTKVPVACCHTDDHQRNKIDDKSILSRFIAREECAYKITAKSL